MEGTCRQTALEHPDNTSISTLGVKVCLCAPESPLRWGKQRPSTKLLINSSHQARESISCGIEKCCVRKRSRRDFTFSRAQPQHSVTDSMPRDSVCVSSFGYYDFRRLVNVHNLQVVKLIAARVMTSQSWKTGKLEFEWACLT